MAKKWHDDDSFWETFEPTLFGQKLMAGTSDEVDNIIKLLDMRNDAHILDLCCGLGRHSLEFARRSFSVTGVDITAKYIEEAKAESSSEGLDVEFVIDDARSFCRENAFDVVLNMSTSFGYFEDPTEDIKVIENIYASLKPGGKFAIDLMGKESLAQFFQERDWHEEDGVVLLSERKISDNWSTIVNRWILLKDGQRYEKEFSLRLYSAYELTELLKKSGFKSVTVYSDLDGSPYNLHAKRLITVAQK